MTFEITVGSADDVQRMARWAGDEGWNPGNTDRSRLLRRRSRRLPDRPPRRRACRLHLGREVWRRGSASSASTSPGRRCVAKATASRFGAPAWLGWKAAMSGSTAWWRSRPTIASRASAAPGTTSATRECRSPRRFAAGVTLLDARERGVRQARGLRPPLLSRGARFLPRVVDHAARARGDGGDVRWRACGLRRHARLPGGVARRARSSPIRPRSPLRCSGTCGQTGATAVAVDMPDINKTDCGSGGPARTEALVRDGAHVYRPGSEIDLGGLFGVTSLELG